MLYRRGLLRLVIRNLYYKSFIWNWWRTDIKLPANCHLLRLLLTLLLVPPLLCLHSSCTAMVLSPPPLSMSAKGFYVQSCKVEKAMTFFKYTFPNVTLGKLKPVPAMRHNTRAIQKAMTNEQWLKRKTCFFHCWRIGHFYFLPDGGNL